MQVASSFELIQLIDIGGAVMTIDRDDERQPDGGFRGRDRDRENRDHHAGGCRGLRIETPEGDEIQVRRRQHHLDADENENRVTPAERREQADAENSEETMRKNWSVAS